MPNRWALEATFEAIGQEPGMKRRKKSTMHYHKLFVICVIAEWIVYNTVSSDFLIDCGPGSAGNFLVIADNV